MARVVLLTGLVGEGFAFSPGMTVEMDDVEAGRHVAAGHARYEGDSAPVPRVPSAKPPEKKKPAEPEASGPDHDVPESTGATDGAEAAEPAARPKRATLATRQAK